MIAIKGWAKFQHFKDRRPPWIKLYRDLLDDREWHKLDGESAKLLTSLWLLASENDGVLPSIDDIAFRLRVSEQHVNACMSKLKHWISADDDNVISSCHQDDPSTVLPNSVSESPNSVPEVSVYQEKEAEREGEERQKPAAPARTQRPRKPQKFPLPEDFGLSQRVITWAAGKGYGQLREHLEAFKRKARAKAYTYADWDEAFMEAVREDWAKLRAQTNGHKSGDLDDIFRRGAA